MKDQYPQYHAWLSMIPEEFLPTAVSILERIVCLEKFARYVLTENVVEGGPLYYYAETCIPEIVESVREKRLDEYKNTPKVTR